MISIRPSGPTRPKWGIAAPNRLQGFGAQDCVRVVSFVSEPASKLNEKAGNWRNICVTFDIDGGLTC